MPSEYVSRQGEAWDQIALSRLSGEHQMGDVLALNIDELDALLLSGETRVSVPEQAAAERVRPPTEGRWSVRDRIRASQKEGL